VPINLVKQVTDQLHAGPPSWGDASISGMVSSLTSDEAAVFNVPDGHAAIILTKTPEDGPSAENLVAHDVIFQINDHHVSDAAQAMRVLNSYGPEEQVTFHLIREGATKTVEITLAEGEAQVDTSPVRRGRRPQVDAHRRTVERGPRKRDDEEERLQRDHTPARRVPQQGEPSPRERPPRRPVASPNS